MIITIIWWWRISSSSKHDLASLDGALIETEKEDSSNAVGMIQVFFYFLSKANRRTKSLDNTEIILSEEKKMSDLTMNTPGTIG